MRKFEITMKDASGDEMHSTRIVTDYGFKSAISLGMVALKAANHKSSDVCEITVRKVVDETVNN